MNNIVCSIDAREKERITYAKRFFHEYNPSVVKLLTGDFVFNNDDGESVCFEYKTMKDFIGSVSSGRIFEQVKRMNDEFDWSFIVLEGTFDDLNRENRRRIIQKNTGRPFSWFFYYGSLAKLNCYVTIVQCHDKAHAFDFIERQMLKIFDEKPLSKNFKHDSDNAVVNYLSCISGIGYNTAELIVDEFQINTLMDLINIVENEDLTNIKGIGKKTAETIKKNIIGG